jgi:hypothetical protein
MSEAIDGIYLENVKVTAFIMKYKGEHIIYSAGKGGVIVSDKDRGIAEKKFTDGMHLAYAVRNLNFFVEAVKADENEREALSKEIRTPNVEIEFIESVC